MPALNAGNVEIYWAENLLFVPPLQGDFPCSVLVPGFHRPRLALTFLKETCTVPIAVFLYQSIQLLKYYIIQSLICKAFF